MAQVTIERADLDAAWAKIRSRRDEEREQRESAPIRTADLHLAVRLTRAALEAAEGRGRPTGLLRYRLRLLQRAAAYRVPDPDLNQDPTFAEVIAPDRSYLEPYTEQFVRNEAAWTRPIPDEIDELVSDQLANLDAARGNVPPSYDERLDPGSAKAEAKRLRFELRRDYARFKQGVAPKPDWDERMKPILALESIHSRARSAFDVDQSFDGESADEAGWEALADMERGEDSSGNAVAWDENVVREIAATSEDDALRLRAHADLARVHVTEFLRDVTSGDRYEFDDPLAPQNPEEHVAPDRASPLAAQLAYEQFREANDRKAIRAIEEIGWHEAIERLRENTGLLGDEVRSYLLRRVVNDPHDVTVEKAFAERMGPDGPEYEFVGKTIRRRKRRGGRRDPVDRSVTAFTDLRLRWCPVPPRRDRTRPQARRFNPERPTWREQPFDVEPPRSDTDAFWRELRAARKARRPSITVTFVTE